jgi:RNA recognition motif-containing protein
MGFKIFVGNLSYDATEEGLKELFAGYGTVESVRIITDRETNKSRGFAFVEMANQGECQNAVKAMDGYRHLNRNLRVNEAQPQAARPRPVGGAGPRPFDRPGGPGPGGDLGVGNRSAPGGGGGGGGGDRNFGPDKEKRRAGSWKSPKKPGAKKLGSDDESGGGRSGRWDSMNDDEK